MGHAPPLITGVLRTVSADAAALNIVLNPTAE